MFDSLIEILNADGFGILGFQKCAARALELGSKEAETAAPYLLLGAAAEQFVNLYEGQPLSSSVAEKEFQSFRDYTVELSEAFSSEDKDQQVAALNNVAARIIASKLA